MDEETFRALGRLVNIVMFIYEHDEADSEVREDAARVKAWINGARRKPSARRRARLLKSPKRALLPT